MNIQRWEVSKAMVEYFLPYSLKVITDRALPDIRDGLKPIHRKIIYKMYAMGMTYKTERAKCATVVGEVLKIHGHGDASVYDALAKLTEQQEGQLYAYIDGEGAFGKQYSTDYPSASRYTFARLNQFAEEFFTDINKDVVRFIGNDKEHRQPLVLPVAFPNILVKQNEGIAVGMSCYFPSFNLKEVCDATVAYINNPQVDLTKYIKAPDFSTGGQLIYDEVEMKKIIAEGRGRLRVRGRYRYDERSNCIEIYEIPHNTTANAIIKQIIDLLEDSQFKGISDVREETGFNKVTEKEELKITIDLKRNTDVEKLMALLFKKTTLEKPFSVNLNCLVDYRPVTLGVKDIIHEWLKFRRECIVKSIKFDLIKLKEQLHILKGYEKVLLDIDKAIEIIRKSKENLIVPNLCKTFDIDEIQAEEIQNMRLRYINKDYILNKIKDVRKFEQEVDTLNSKVTNLALIDKDIITQLNKISKQYAKTRKTEIIYGVKEIALTEEIQDYNCMYFLTKEHYIKKIPLTSLRASSSEHKLKEGDKIISEFSGNNLINILVFSSNAVCYKLKGNNLSDTSVTKFGDYLPSVVGLDKNEYIVKVIITNDYSGDILFAFENGKVARVQLASYETKTNRSKLINAYSNDSKLVNIMHILEDVELLCKSSINKVLIVDTAELNTKASKATQGVQVMKQKLDSVMDMCLPLSEVVYNLDTDDYRGSIGTIGTTLSKSENVNKKE